MKDYDQEARKMMIEARGFKAAEKLIYEWVKKGDINLRQFRELNECNRFASA